MEQKLIEALEKAQKPEDIDDVSMAMIMTRVTSALMEVRDVTDEYLKKLEAIQKEHDMELKMGGLSVILNVTDDLSSCNEPVQMCILGRGDKTRKNIAQIMEKVNG